MTHCPPGTYLAIVRGAFGGNALDADVVAFSIPSFRLQNNPFDHDAAAQEYALRLSLAALERRKARRAAVEGLITRKELPDTLFDWARALADNRQARRYQAKALAEDLEFKGRSWVCQSEENKQYMRWAARLRKFADSIR